MLPDKKKKLICFFLSAVSATREREKEKLPGQLEWNLHRIFIWFSADVVQGNIYQIDYFRLAITLRGRLEKKIWPKVRHV